MVYSDVVKNNWHKILPKKEKYTISDVKKVWIHGFISGHIFTDSESKFIVICTAIVHHATCSKNVYGHENEYTIL